MRSHTCGNRDDLKLPGKYSNNLEENAQSEAVLSFSA